jgi:hypothetical protein
MERQAYGDALATLLTQRATPPRASAAAPVVARATRGGRFSRLGRFLDDLRSRRD